MSVEAEVKAIKNFFEGSNTVQRLRYDDGERSLAFALNTGKKALRFQFFVPFGYPDDKSPDERPTLMQEDGLHEELVEKVNEYARTGKNLVDTMQFLVTNFTSHFSLKASRDVSGLSSKMEVDTPEKEEGKKGSDGKGKKKKPKKKASSDDEEYFSDGEGGEFLAGSPRLREDVEEVEAYFGKGCVKYFPELQMVRLFVDTGFIPAATAGALGLDCTIPINVSLHFGDEYINSPTAPKFEIDQKPNNDLFGLQFQLTEITRAWLNANWGKSSYDTGIPPPKDKDSASASKQSDGKKGFFSSIFGGKGEKEVKVDKMEEDEEYCPEKKYPKQLKELLDMGFERSLVLYALHHTSGKVEEATHMCLDPQPWFLEEAEKAAKNGSSARRVLSHSQAAKGRTNFLIALMTYIRSRIANCSNHCPICDYRHECDGVKPIVCSKPDCVWRYEELGLGANVNAEIARAPEVVDLLISLAVSATTSNRADDIFTPFPSDFLDASGKKDFQKLKSVLEDLPPVGELASQSEIRAYVDKLDPNPVGHKQYYRLTRWLLTSNRAHLIRLPEHLQIKEMQTPYQYMLLTSTPEKEARFSAYKKQYGSFMAFHGSPMENWHSILHNGLRNMSNTKGMLHGAAHGAGIYLAPNAGTSQGYMRAGTGWSRSQFGSSASCLAMCEVISHPDIYGINHDQWCYVVKEDDHVMTRFFFIYSGSGGSFPTGAVARQLQLPDVSQELAFK